MVRQYVTGRANTLAGGHCMGGEHDHLADNIKALRETRGLSQQQMAKAAGIPRATWPHLESGGANTTPGALRVGRAELLAAPRQRASFLRAAELPTRDRGRVLIRKLLPEPLPGLDM